MTTSNLSSLQPLERHINIKVPGLAERTSASPHREASSRDTCSVLDFQAINEKVASEEREKLAWEHSESNVIH